MDFADRDPTDFELRDSEDPATTFMDAIDRDPIATLRIIVRAVRLFLTSIGHSCSRVISIDPFIFSAAAILFRGLEGSPTQRSRTPP